MRLNKKKEIRTSKTGKNGREGQLPPHPTHEAKQPPPLPPHSLKSSLFLLPHKRTAGPLGMFSVPVMSGKESVLILVSQPHRALERSTL